MDMNIPSGAPAQYLFGILDDSAPTVPLLPETLPQHLPIVFTYGQTGPDNEPVFTPVSNLVNLFGALTFDLQSRFATHQSPLITEAFVKKTNAMMMYRVTPDDAKKSFVTIYADLLPVNNVPNYQHDPLTGAIVYDSEGDPVLHPVVDEVAGYAVSFGTDSVLRSGSPFHPTDVVANVATHPGVLVDAVGAPGATSIRFPICTVVHSFKGVVGDNTAIRMWSPVSENGTIVPTALINQLKMYPVNFMVAGRDDEYLPLKPKVTLKGATSVSTGLKPETYHPSTKNALYLGEGVVSSYRKIDDPQYTKVYGPISEIKVYQKNIDHILGLLHAAEVATWTLETTPGATLGRVVGTDFSSDSGDKYMYNLLGGKASNGAPYRSIRWEDNTDAVRLTSGTSIFLGGGSDGTLRDADGNYPMFDLSVRNYMNNYADSEHRVQNIAKNVETEVYDTGFSHATKLALLKMIAIRKNTHVHWATYINPKSVPEQDALAALLFDIANGDADTPGWHIDEGEMLRTAASLYPESDYFNTSVCRATITPSTELLRNSRYKDRVSCIIERAAMRAGMMGGGDGRWRMSEAYDGSPGSVLKLGYNILPEHVSPTNVFNAWDRGLVFPVQFDTKSFHFPVFRTIYDTDASNLISDMFTSCCATVNSVVCRVDRELKGKEGIRPSVLAAMYNQRISAYLKDRFGGKYVITPMAQFSTMDEFRGNSITVPVRIEGSTPNTVMFHYVQAVRFQDA